ncbi:MAG: hypothetical protein IKC77_07180 [Lentisphaeria bacterium]|nr:hypothetical protein [Lentisphaeria bacterium]
MVESTKNKILYVIGESRSFPFNYKFIKPEDIHLFLETDDSAVELVRGKDFTVEVKEDYSDGALVTLNIDPLPTGKKLAICRICDLFQQLSLLEHGKLPSKPIEADFDKIFMILQQLQEELDRTLKTEVTSTYDPVAYFKNLSTITVNAKDVALNAADSAAHSALTASVCERNMSLIWAELTGDDTLAENALITVKEAAEATGAIKVAKEIAIGEITNIGATAIASTQQAAKEATDAAKAATDSAGSISGTIADQLSIQISQAVGAEGALGAAIAGGIKDVESARQDAIDSANSTLKQLQQGITDFNDTKNSGLQEIQNKINSVSIDVQTVLERAQLIADGYLDDARATVSGSIEDLQKMRENAVAAGKTDLVDIIDKRIAELETLNGYLDDANSASSAAERFRNAADSAANSAAGFANQAAGSLQAAQNAATSSQNYADNSANSAAEALRHAQDAALKASDAEASALAAGSAADSAATSAAEKSITLHNASSESHKNLFGSKLSLSGGTMTGKIIAPRDFINRDVDTDWITIVGGTSWESSGRIQLFGGKNTTNPGYVTITATDGTNTNNLLLRPDGACFAGGKHIVRSVNGVTANVYGNVNLPGLITSVREIPANADLNTFTTPGYWNVQSDATAKTFTNCPVQVSFVLEVYGSTWMTYQRITRYLTGEMWVRTYYSSRGWSAWREVAIRQAESNATQSALHGGMKYGEGASLVLWGMNHNNGTDAPGMFKLRAVNSDGTYSELLGTPAGGMTWNSVDITLGYPNYAAGTKTTASTYTAAADGWVMVKKQQEGKYLNIKVNGYLAGTGGGSDHDRTTAMFPVKAADVVTVFASDKESTDGTATTADITFFPNR